MGKGYYFNFETESKARKAANTFYVKAIRRFHCRARTLGITRTTGNRYIAGVDVCGPANPKIDELCREVTNAVANGR